MPLSAELFPEDFLPGIPSHCFSAEGGDLNNNAQVTPNGERVTWLSRARLLELVRTMSNIETLTFRRWRTNVARDCERPQSITLGYRPDRNIPSGRFMYRGFDACLFLHMEVMCRRCTACLRRRASHWRLKCMAEGMFWPRTWKVTLTYRPEERQLCDYGAMREARLAGLNWWNLEPDEQFLWKCRVGKKTRTYGSLVTLFLKRLRKSSGVATLRYVSIAEAHESGDPHMHLLVHQCHFDQPLLKRQIQSAWWGGFSNVKLVTDVHELTYACKYLSKSLATRVRASQGYGREVIRSKHSVNVIHQACLDP